MDRALWKKLLAQAPPRDPATAELLGKLLIEWTDEPLGKWFGARLRWDPALPYELNESAAEFLAVVTRGNFGCLDGVPAEKREAYLRRMLWRCVARHLARQRELQERLASLADFQVGDEGEERELDADDFPSADPGPEDQVVQRMVWEEVLAVVAAMPKPRRDVFHDRHEEGRTARETADHLHLPLGTVQWHDREILATLKRHIARNGP